MMPVTGTRAASVIRSAAAGVRVSQCRDEGFHPVRQRRQLRMQTVDRVPVHRPAGDIEFEAQIRDSVRADDLGDFQITLYHCMRYLQLIRNLRADPDEPRYPPWKPSHSYSQSSE